MTYKHIRISSVVAASVALALGALPVFASEVTGTLSSGASSGSNAGGGISGGVGGGSTVSGTLTGGSSGGGISGTVSGGGGGGGGGNTVTGGGGPGGGGSVLGAFTSNGGGGTGTSPNPPGSVLGAYIAQAQTPGLPNTGGGGAASIAQTALLGFNFLLPLLLFLAYKFAHGRRKQQIT